MAKIKTLYQNGQQIMPVTHPKAVMDENGETLEAKLSKINKRLDACGNGGSMSGQLVGSASGTSVSVSDALAAPLIGLRVFGKSTQDGTPMPTAPAPITSAGGSGTVTVRLTGENLLNPSLFQDGQYQNFDSNSANFGIVTNSNYWITGLQPCVPGTAYHISHAFSGGCFYNESQQPLGAISVGESFRTPAKCGYFCLNFEKSTVAFGGQVSAALGDAVYAPYTEQTLTLQTPNTLPGIPVSSGGNYTDENGQQWVCDEVDLEKGVKVQRVNAVDFSTCEIVGNFNLGVTKRITYTLPLNACDANTNALCNKLQHRASFDKDTPHFYADAVRLHVFIPIGAKNPEEGEYILFYALATPIETPLTPAEIAAYKALTTYAPTTTISVSDGAGATVTYQRDAILVIKRLEEAIASTAAVSSLSM